MAEIQSLARGLRILDYVIDAGRGVSVTELADELEMDKSTVSRLVQTLVSGEYLQPEVGTRRYTLGRRLFKVSWSLINRVPVRAMAHPYLERLVALTDECAHTAVYAEGKAWVIDDVEAENSLLRVVGQTGRMIPLHCTAVGKSILAFAGVPYPTELQQFTARTITDTKQLHNHIEEVCQRGYAVDNEEYDSGVRCIAAPVLDAHGMAVACVGISGPTVRVTRERVGELAQIVMQQAKLLSAALIERASQHGKDGRANRE